MISVQIPCFLLLDLFHLYIVQKESKIQSMNINKAFVYGHLTRDPEMRALPSGMNVTTFSVATNRRYKDRNDNFQETVEYHNVVVFGRQAETVYPIFTKRLRGCLLRVGYRPALGREEEVKHYRTEIIAERVQFGPKSGDGGGARPSTANTTNNDNHARQQPEAPDAQYQQEDEINPEDIPF